MYINLVFASLLYIRAGGHLNTNKMEETVNIYTRKMTMLRRVSLSPEELNGNNIQTISIADFCNPQRQYKYAARIAEIRSFCPDAETKERNKQIVDRLKTSLPAGIISCVADGLGESNVIERNGVMAIDIDASKNPAITDWQAVKRELAKSPYIAYCGLSVSGLGVWGMIPIADPSKHFEHFRAICKDFQRQFCITQYGDSEPTILNGINLDSAPSNIISKRFVSYDPQPYTNTLARVYERTEPIPQPRRSFFSGTTKEFDLEGWLKAHGIDYNARYRHGGIQYIVRCPNASQHSSRHKAESALFVHPNGAIGYKCHHDHCVYTNPDGEIVPVDWHWFRRQYEPEYNPNGHREPFRITRLSQADIQNALKSAGFSSAPPKPVLPPSSHAEATTRTAKIPLFPQSYSSPFEDMTQQDFNRIFGYDAVLKAMSAPVPF